MLFDVARFAKIRDLTGLTPGNLATHLDNLERAGYLTQRDAIINKKPGKLIGLTPKGRDAFRAYVASLEALLADLKSGSAASPPGPSSAASP